MARKPRNELSAGIYHVYSRGVAKQPIFRDEIDRRTYLSILGRVVQDKGWRLYAYCLMENHIHLVAETIDANLGRGMQRLHGGFGAAFNARHDRVGPLFQGRFQAVRIESDAQLVATVAYVVRNPVEAGLCSRPENWSWSSHASVLLGATPPWLDADGLLAYFGEGAADPLDRYRRLAETGVAGTEGTVPVVIGG